LGGAPAAFTGNQLVAKADPPHDERLNDPARTDRARQLLERLLAETCPRLVGAGVDEVDIDLQQNVIRRVARRRAGCQRWGYCRCCSRRPQHRLLLRRLLGGWFRLPDQGAESPSQSVSGHWQ
jgi:hypothetical protein